MLLQNKKDDAMPSNNQDKYFAIDLMVMTSKEIIVEVQMGKIQPNSC
jgi:hypothetical protein